MSLRRMQTVYMEISYLQKIMKTIIVINIIVIEKCFSDNLSYMRNQVGELAGLLNLFIYC